MAISGAVSYVDISRRKKRVGVVFTLSGDYTTGGEAVDFTALTNPKNHIGGYIGAVPDDAAEDAIAGYPVEVTLGTSLTNSKLKLYSAPGVELAAGAYPAAITADTNGVGVEFVLPIGKG